MHQHTCQGLIPKCQLRKTTRHRRRCAPLSTIFAVCHLMACRSCNTSSQLGKSSGPRMFLNADCDSASSATSLACRARRSLPAASTISPALVRSPVRPCRCTRSSQPKSASSCLTARLTLDGETPRLLAARSQCRSSASSTKHCISRRSCVSAGRLRGISRAGARRAIENQCICEVFGARARRSGHIVGLFRRASGSRLLGVVTSRQCAHRYRLPRASPSDAGSTGGTLLCADCLLLRKTIHFIARHFDPLTQSAESGLTLNEHQSVTQYAQIRALRIEYLYSL